MSFKLSRVILFTADMDEMTAFYRDVLALPFANEEPGWVELDAGATTIALHAWDGEAADGPAKLVFFAEDVAAARDLLLARGAPMGEIVMFGDIALCDGRDPDGNMIQISSRPRA